MQREKLPASEYWPGRIDFKNCPECRKEQEAEEVESNKRKLNESIRNYISDANIPERFKHKDIETLAGFNEGIISLVKEFIAVGNKNGMMFIGPNGTGKTHVAIGVLKAYIRRHNKKGLFTETTKIIRSIKNAWNMRQSELDIIDKFVKPDLLVIDEIGVGFQSETETLYLTEIINDRYNALKPTIIISNFNLIELTEILGERVIDRFREGGKLIVFDGGSFRGDGNSVLCKNEQK
jgi:DNA replication protein DnaC